jgi:phosphoglycerate dehydrogenase-like enzyme
MPLPPCRPLRLAVLDDYQGVAARFLGHVGDDVEVVVFHDHVDDEDELVARLEPFDCVVAMRERTPFPARVLERLPGLKLLVTTGMGNASIDVDAAAARGIVVCGTGAVGAPTAELTIGLMLALARRIPHEDALVRAGGWQSTLGVELRGKTLGVVGLGNLGARVARVALALGMSVVAWSENLTPERAEEVDATRAASLQALLAVADVVTIHLRLSDRTRGLLGRDELAAMKPTAFLVNTSRGPIVDEAALVAALHDGTIAGAALDVFDVEPLPEDHPLRTAPNAVLTPHVGYVTEENYRVFYAEAAEDIRGFRAGDPIRVLS